VSRQWVVVLLLICAALNGAGFMWNLFEPIPLYDEIAHFITPFTLVLITAEIIYRAGGDDEFFNTPRRDHGLRHWFRWSRWVGGHRDLARSGGLPY
jgi:hypothetical protein